MDPFLPFLGFDLSTPATLVVLVPRPGRIVSRRKSGGNRAEGLFPAIAEVLDEAGLVMREVRSLGVGRGPGAFTGIRNAVMAAKTLAWANGIPLYAPGTLEVLARGSVGGDVVVPLVDARRGEVYGDVYLRDGDALMPTGGPVVLPPGALAGLISARAGGRDGEVLLVGTGAQAYREACEPLGRVADDPHPLPEAVWESCLPAITAGRPVDPMDLLPLYIRDPDAVMRRPPGRS